MRRSGIAFRRVCDSYCIRCDFRKEEEKEMMANISFIAILIGAAGIDGGLGTGNMVGTIVAAVIHIGGIVGMAIAVRKEGDDKTDEEKEDDCVDPDGSSPVDKPYGIRAGRHAADRSGRGR